MNNSIRVMRRPWRARPAATRTAGAAIAATLALLAAACGGSPSSAGTAGTAGSGGSSNAGGSTSSQLLSFARCMRSKGVPSFPDPTADKFPSAQQLKVSDSVYRTAMSDCRHLLPSGSGGSSEAQAQQQAAAMLPFSQCMRSHGIPNWPDPTVNTGPDGNPGVVFNVLGINGLDHEGIDSPQVKNTEQECLHLMPPSFTHFRFMRN